MDEGTRSQPSALWNTNGYLAAIQGMLQCSRKAIELCAANCQTSVDLLHQWSADKSPSAFIQCTTTHARKQFETLSDQAKQLAELAQKVAISTVEEESAARHAG
jgi:hypothetical protein